MKTSEELKQIVKDKYSEIALQSKEQNESSCCGATACCTTDFTAFSEDYSTLSGYNADADLGLGCGLPTEYAKIKAGDTVLDLGSGAGNDCFVARAITGESGRVIGLDMTEAMIEKAKTNAGKLGFANVEFVLGEIENMPLETNAVDVVVSNCVLNLVPDKQKAFSEIFRVLKPGGHFSISDVVLSGSLPASLQGAAEMYAGCVSGALQKEEYLAQIKGAGFVNVTIQKERGIHVPEQILLNYLSAEELAQFKESGAGMYSITVYGEKPAGCCVPGSGCC